jgi:putative DNA primase/helicase
MRIGRKIDTQCILERLLSISGEDTISVPRKHCVDWVGRLITRIVILTNKLPTIADTSGALVTRFIILRPNPIIFGPRGPGLESKLRRESSGILNWSLDGLERLRKPGRFIQPESGRGTIDDFKNLTNPIGAFIRERCIVGEGRKVFCDSLHECYCDCAKQQGHEHTPVEAQFGADLRAAVPSVVRRRAGPKDRRRYFYDGISLTQEDWEARA